MVKMGYFYRSTKEGGTKMTQEDKQLLLVGLCARLPYGVKVWYKYYPNNVTEKFATSIRLVDGKIALSSKFNKEGDWYPIEEAGEILIKPYLRPMLSMTEEEKETYHNLCYEEESEAFEFGEWVGKIYYHDTIDSIDYLNSIYIDYRGLIEKGLSLEAPEGMYKDGEQ